jgi:hypothetical protein
LGTLPFSLHVHRGHAALHRSLNKKIRSSRFTSIRTYDWTLAFFPSSLSGDFDASKSLE